MIRCLYKSLLFWLFTIDNAFVNINFIVRSVQPLIVASSISAKEMWIESRQILLEQIQKNSLKVTKDHRHPLFGEHAFRRRTPLQIRPNKKILFPVPARITFGERIKKSVIFYFIEFGVFGTTINCFLMKADPFCPLF